MKTAKPYRIIGIALVVLGAWIIIAIPAFLMDEKRGAETYRTRIQPAIAEQEAELNVSALDETDRLAVTKLNRWIVLERSSRIDYFVASAFFAMALILLLAGLTVILFGRIRAIEKEIKATQPPPPN